MDVHKLSKFAVAGTIQLIWWNGNLENGGHIYSVNFSVNTQIWYLKFDWAIQTSQVKRLLVQWTAVSTSKGEIYF